MRMDFAIHEQLASDGIEIGELELCTVLVMRDHRFPWTVLVPRIPGLRDFHDLPREHVAQLFEEVSLVSRMLIGAFDCEKINVAALGNMVPQLHVHVIGRYAHDVAWPGPVWNAGAVGEVDYPVVDGTVAVLREGLASSFRLPE